MFQRMARVAARRKAQAVKANQRSPSSFRLQSTSPQSAKTSRFDRMNNRLPRFLRKYTTPLRDAPLSHISAFLILHEITAIVPLFGLAGAFHYYQWLPPFVSEWQWVSDGVVKFGNYFRRKGWLGAMEEQIVIDDQGNEKAVGASRRAAWWNRGEGATRIVVEFATAYALTKALLPLRLVLSVWATPWFARTTLLPITNRFGTLLRKRSA